MGRYRSRRPQEIAAGQVRAQAAVVQAARKLRDAADRTIAAADPEEPFAPTFAAAAADLFTAADDATDPVRRSVVLALAGIHSHELLGEIVGRSRYWVGATIRREKGAADD